MLRRTLLIGIAVLAGSAGLTTAASAQFRPGGPPQARPGTWALLGTQSVGFGVDKDVVKVGRQDGRFRAIKLRVRNNAIEMLDLKVVYANGEFEDFPVRAIIRAGGETRAIDLKGNTRFIQEVQMVYKSKLSFRGKALVEVWGQH